jgi:hypothetical protein
LVEVVERKLKVVIRPVGVVKYCKHPFGGLNKICRAIQQSKTFGFVCDYLDELLHEICDTFISNALVVLACVVENVKARVAVSVATAPMST